MPADAKLSEIHRRIDQVNENRFDDMRTVNKCISNMKESVSEINADVSSIHTKVGSIEKISEKFYENLDSRVKYMVAGEIQNHESRCPASSLLHLKERGLVDEVLNFGKKHPVITGGSVASIIISGMKLIEYLL